MAVKKEISTQVKEGLKEGLNLQEISWCETYLRTLSIKQACTESGLRIREASEMLQKPAVIEYIMNRSDQYRQALEIEKQDKLTRDELAKVLQGIILSPIAKEEVKLQAITRLNAMMEFDKANNITPEDEQEEAAQIKISAEEAEKMLAQMRLNSKKKYLLK